MKIYSILSYIDALKDAGLLKNSRVVDSTLAIEHITYDSKKTKEYTLFACKGAAFKKDYLDEAVKNQIACYMSETEYETERPVSFIIVSDVRKAMALVANMFYDQPQDKLTVIGITGTKGKTTTAFYTKFILDEYLQAIGERPCGLISTVEVYDGKSSEPAQLSTPEAFEVYRHLDNAVSAGLKYFVMEVSSQALKYDRVLGISFDCSAFLNISKDHISPNEHSDFDDYFNSKLKLFATSKNAIVNLNSEKGDIILDSAKQWGNTITFSTSDTNADFYCHSIKKMNNQLHFSICKNGADTPFKLAISGLFNAENATAAIALACHCNIPLEYAQGGLSKAFVPGRMETFYSADNDVVAVVDYAHNKLSFEKVYESIESEYEGYSVVTVFGCPGGKALNRREELGRLAGKHSDYVYLTADDPGFEGVANICKDISQYVACGYEIIEDRETAIKTAISRCKRPCVVIIAGKGHENCQKEKGKRVSCKSDVDSAKQYLTMLEKKTI